MGMHSVGQDEFKGLTDIDHDLEGVLQDHSAHPSFRMKAAQLHPCPHRECTQYNSHLEHRGHNARQQLEMRTGMSAAVGQPDLAAVRPRR